MASLLRWAMGGWTPVSTPIARLGAATTVDTSGVLSRNLNKPTMADGCVVVLVASGNFAGPALVTAFPSGFTFVRRVLDGTNTYFDIYYKVISSAATESAATWTMTYDNTSKGVYHALSFTGVDTTTPFEVENGQAEAAGGPSPPTTHTTPSITTTSSGCVLISSFADRNTVAATYDGAVDIITLNDNTGATNAITQLTQVSSGGLAAGTYSRSIVASGLAVGGYTAAVMWIGALKPAVAGTNFTDTRTDDTGLTDSTAAAIGFGRTQDDPVGLTDSVSSAAAYSRTQDDPAGLVDSVVTALAYARQQDDTTGLVDAVSAALSAARRVDDSAGLTDTLVTIFGKVIQQDDPLGLTDTVAAVLAYARTQTDSAGLTDAVAAALSYVRSQTDTSGLVDTLATALAYARQLDDTSGLTDSISFSLVGGFGPQTFTDDSGLTDSVVTTMSAVRSFADALGLSDDVVVALSSATYFFTTPTRKWKPVELLVAGGLWPHTYMNQGITVLKTGGFYRQVEQPFDEDLVAADRVYLGGRTYPIDQAERDALVAAGYGAYITT